MKSLTEKQLRTLLETRWDDMQRVFPGYSRRFLEAERRRAKDALPTDTRVAIDADRLASAARLRESERLYRAALDESARVRLQLDQLMRVPAASPRDVTIKSKPGEREATALILSSDWHCEEEVKPSKVNGLNEYNLEIFDSRSRWFFHNAAKMLHKEAKSINIRNAILWLGGDGFSGHIHNDLKASTLIGPIPAASLYQNTIIGGVEYLLMETPADFVVTLVISLGNHSRITDEIRVQTEADNSLEAFIATNLARHFASNRRVRVVFEGSYLTYVEVHGRLIRFHHGHAIKYKDGVGGLTIPVAKRIDRWNQGRHAYLDCFGHFHTLMFGQNFISNGSLIGYSPFAVKIGAPPQPPQQAFALIDSKYGLTVRAPILLEDVSAKAA